MNYHTPIRPALSVQVSVEFDDEAKVWVATSVDVPGLVAEHADLSALEDMVVELIPILLIENDLIPEGLDLPVEVPIHFFVNALGRRSAVVSG